MHRGPLPSSRRFDPQALTSLTYGQAYGILFDDVSIHRLLRA